MVQSTEQAAAQPTEQTVVQPAASEQTMVQPTEQTVVQPALCEQIVVQPTASEQTVCGAAS